jgi:hypothetical protein
MGKLTGIIKLEGTFDGLTFYKSRDGYLVKTKSGVSKKRIMTDPAFARTRENINEFGLNAQSGTQLRNSIGPLLIRAKDSRLSSRLFQLMSQIKNYDSSSQRGLRRVHKGLATTEGMLLLRGFDFNARAGLQTVLHAPYTLDTATGSIVITDFVPQQQLVWPEGASHVSLRSGFVNLDFETGVFDSSFSPVSQFSFTAAISSLNLLPLAVPLGLGTQLYFLLIEFSQEVNGISYALNNGAFNVLNLVEVL